MYSSRRFITLLTIVLTFSGCDSGESDKAIVIDPVTEVPPETADLVLAMQSASLTNLIDFYLLPDSDDFENIPQDPMNPITAERVEVGKLIYHDPAFATEGVALRAKTWSCASCHNARAGFKSGMTQGIGEGGEGFGIKGEERVWHDESRGTQDADVQPVTSPTVLNVAYQDVMLWNGALGNSTNGIINAGIDPDRLMTEGTPKEANSQGFSGIETPSNCGNRCSSNRDFPA